MNENDFKKRFGSNSPLPPYNWSDDDYASGWDITGDMPPTRQQFDALQRTNDDKAAYLLDKVYSSARLLRRSTHYNKGDRVYAEGLKAGLYLECATAGMSGTDAIDFSSSLIGDTITDGGVTWTVVKYALTTDVPPLASALATPRKIELTGNVTGSADFDGSKNIQIATTLVRGEGLTYLIPNNAGAHNAIYRGKYLGTAVTDAQWAAISTGTFEDLFIGDYWTINSVNWRIAAFDYWLHCGDTGRACTTHHVVIVPDTSLANVQMNSTSTTDGGYVGSDFYTGANNNTGKATAVSEVNAAFGSSHILTHREALTNAVRDGKPTSVGWYNSTVELMNEAMVYGAHFFEPNPNVYTIDKTQLPLFAYDPSRIVIIGNWWLRGVVAAGFATINGTGRCFYTLADITSEVRPAFGIA